MTKLQELLFDFTIIKAPEVECSFKNVLPPSFRSLKIPVHILRCVKSECKVSSPSAFIPAYILQTCTYKHLCINT